MSEMYFSASITDLFMLPEDDGERRDFISTKVRNQIFVVIIRREKIFF